MTFKLLVAMLNIFAVLLIRTKIVRFVDNFLLKQLSGCCLIQLPFSTNETKTFLYGFVEKLFLPVIIFAVHLRWVWYWYVHLLFHLLLLAQTFSFILSQPTNYSLWCLLCWLLCLH